MQLESNEESKVDNKILSPMIKTLPEKSAQPVDMKDLKTQLLE